MVNTTTSVVRTQYLSSIEANQLISRPRTVSGCNVRFSIRLLVTLSLAYIIFLFKIKVSNAGHMW